MSHHCDWRRLMNTVAGASHVTVGVFAGFMSYYNFRRGNPWLGAGYAALLVNEVFRTIDHT